MDPVAAGRSDREFAAFDFDVAFYVFVRIILVAGKRESLGVVGLDAVAARSDRDVSAADNDRILAADTVVLAVYDQRSAVDVKVIFRRYTVVVIAFDRQSSVTCNLKI